MKKLFLYAVLWAIFTPSLAYSLPITVSFDVLDSEIYVGEQFSVNLVAEIPIPVSGFGLDISFNETMIELVMPPIIGSDWSPIFSPDGDGLAGLAPFPLSVFGSGILLANFTFDAISAGTTSLIASFSLGDFTEGFPLAFPAPPGSFAEVNFLNTSVIVLETTPVPEPSTLLLIFAGLVALFGLSNCKKTNYIKCGHLKF